MIKTVLFDVDGTILDTEFVMIKSLQKTLKEEKNLDVPEENEFEHFGLSKLFDISVTASDTTKHKPNPEPILYALNKLGSLPEETIYIGDSIYDMHSSQSAGAKFALAKWGAKENPLFSSADIRLETPLEILQHLK